MFGFIKKLFGGTTVTNKEAGVQLEQSAPYKVPEPAATTPIPLVVDKATEAVVKSLVKPAAKKKYHAKKKAGTAKTAPAKKPAAKTAPAKTAPAKKPKAKPAA